MRQSRPVLQGSEKWKWLIIQAEAYLLWVAIMLQKERSVPKQLGSSRCLNTLQKMPFVPKRAKWYSNLRTGTIIILVNGIFLCSNAVLASDTSQSKYLLKTTLSLDSFLDLERREKKRQCKMLCDVCPCCHFSSSWGLKRCWQAGLLVTPSSVVGQAVAGLREELFWRNKKPSWLWLCDWGSRVELKSKSGEKAKDSVPKKCLQDEFFLFLK